MSKKKIQLVTTLPEWCGLGIFNVDKMYKKGKTNSATFVAYDWILLFGFWQLRHRKKVLPTIKEIKKPNEIPYD